LIRSGVNELQRVHADEVNAMLRRRRPKSRTPAAE
jgi:hypothetical protein